MVSISADHFAEFLFCKSIRGSSSLVTWRHLHHSGQKHYVAVMIMNAVVAMNVDNFAEIFFFNKAA